MTWHIVDATGRPVAVFASRVSGEIGVIPSGTTLYAGVVDYGAGAVVAWSLAWAPTAAGTPPVLVPVSDSKIGVLFANPSQGGARGVATLTATVNGVTASGGLTATVAPV